jgi:hypothetical protein
MQTDSRFARCNIEKPSVRTASSTSSFRIAVRNSQLSRRESTGVYPLMFLSSLRVLPVVAGPDFLLAPATPI